MKIAVLSGKGGTGKTLVSVNLAELAGEALYLDCDVEEPNGYLFFKPQQLESQAVTVKIPVVDQEKCTGCRQCVDFCQFNALAYIKDRLIVFEEICHSCGGCVLVCPEKAFTEKDKEIGRIERGVSGHVQVHTGILNPGEESGTPIINCLLGDSDDHSDLLTVIDCPPGTSCIVMDTVAGADYCVLVAEPTIFGAHNLAMVHELVTLMGKPFGVVLNKIQEGDNPSGQFCKDKEIPVLGRIPFDQKLGLLNSNGAIAVREDEAYRRIFSDLLAAIRKEAGL
ncbi:MAG: 4Fe-4S binding protein [Clostridiaceae bacterium]|nr:4Fe-4S binding protein [Clostridiaceae bacterium]